MQDVISRQVARALAGVAAACLLMAGCEGGKAPASASNDRLRALVEAYQKAKTYADAGELRVELVRDGQKIASQAIPFSVTFERPNKVRIESFSASVVSDGKSLWGIAARPDLNGQVLFHDAPEELTLKSIDADPLLSESLSNGTGIGLPQLELLLGQNPVKTLFGSGEKVRALSSEKLEADDRQPCQRWQVTSSKGKYVLWIDPATQVLRRLEMESPELARQFELPEDSNAHFQADFQGAKLNEEVPKSAFEFEAPPSAKLVKHFVKPPAELTEPPNPMLGRRPAPFRFLDLDGKTVAQKSLEGKVVVLDMWTTDCKWCFVSFPNLQKVYERFKDNDRVSILAVNNDAPTTPDKMIQAAMDRHKLNLPVVRDQEEFARSTFKVQGFPTMIVLGTDGTVQDFEMGYNPKLADTLPAKIDQLLAGENLAEEARLKYARASREFEHRLAEATVGATQQIELPQTPVAERSQPTSLKLSKLWTAEGLKHPGNLVVVDGQSAQPRIFVLDGWQAVAEIDADGKLIAEHELTGPSNGDATLLRTAVDSSGKRFYVVFTVSLQRLHVYDDQWTLLASYPEGDHAGLSDVQLTDLDGDGQLELNVAYMGTVGVQCASLSGKRLWSNRSQDNVLSLAAIGPEHGPRRLLAANGRNALAVIDAEGLNLPDITVPERVVDVVVAADLDGDTRLELAGLSASKLGELVVIGLNTAGELLWNYALPMGVPHTPVERIVPGRTGSQGPGQWLLTGVDGSIHILAADGQPIDRFNFGAELTGIGSMLIDGQPILLVATDRELTAWAIEPLDSAESAGKPSADEARANDEAAETVAARAKREAGDASSANEDGSPRDATDESDGEEAMESSDEAPGALSPSEPADAADSDASKDVESDDDPQPSEEPRPTSI